MLVNVRWINIPEEMIYQRFKKLGIKTWRNRIIQTGNLQRHYLFGEQYAYPYSLPVEVIDRLVKQLNEVSVFDHDHWYAKMLATPGYNDTVGQVVVEPRPNITWAVLGVHKLTKEEQPPYPTIYFDVRCKDANRDGMKPVYWQWVGMKYHEKPAPAFADKPMHEVPTIAILPGMDISMWMDNSNLVYGLKRDNSYFVVFQEIDRNEVPDPPDPEPPTQVQATIIVFANIDWLNTLPVDNQRNIVFEVKNE
jgi:hypothetical protein